MSTQMLAQRLRMAAKAKPLEECRRERMSEKERFLIPGPARKMPSLKSECRCMFPFLSLSSLFVYICLFLSNQCILSISRFKDLPKDHLFDFLSEGTKRSHLEIGRRLCERNLITEEKFKEYFPNRPVSRPKPTNITPRNNDHNAASTPATKKSKAPPKKTTTTKHNNTHNKVSIPPPVDDDDDDENINLEEIFASSRKDGESNSESSQGSLGDEVDADDDKDEGRSEKGKEKVREKEKPTAQAKASQISKPPSRTAPLARGSASGNAGGQKPSSPISPIKRYNIFSFVLFPFLSCFPFLILFSFSLPAEAKDVPVGAVGIGRRRPKRPSRLPLL